MASVAALEAERADSRAVPAAVNALGVNQREYSERLSAVESCLDRVAGRLGTVDGVLGEHTGYLRSLDKGQAEVKDLLIRALGNR